MSVIPWRKFPEGTEAFYEPLPDERAIRHLIDKHGHAVPIGDLPWLGGILGKLRQGYPLTTQQVARVSAIRGVLAKTRRFNWTATQSSPSPTERHKQNRNLADGVGIPTPGGDAA